MRSKAQRRHRVKVLQKIQTQGSDGSFEKTWSPMYTVWADIEEISSREFIAAKGEAFELTSRITVSSKARSLLNETMRLKHGDRVFSIVGFTNNRHGDCFVMAVEGPRTSDGGI